MKKIISLLIAALFLFAAGSTVFAADSGEQESVTPSGIAMTNDGTLLITDLYNKVLWSQKDGIVTQLTGDQKISGVNGTPVGGYRDGTPQEALFQSPWAIAPYGSGYAVTDTKNNVLRFYDGSKVTTIAGKDYAAFMDGNGTAAEFNQPTGLAADGNGNLYIADTGNHAIRKMDASGNVTTYAGGIAGNASGSLSSARFREPMGLYFANGVLYVADSGNHRICKIENNQVTTLAGTAYAAQSGSFYQGGYRDGAAAVAEFSNPQGIAVENGVVYVADTGNGALRKLENGIVSTILARASADDLYPVSPRSIVIHQGKLFVTDVFADGIHLLELPASPSRLPGKQDFSPFGLTEKAAVPKNSGTVSNY